MTLSSGVLVLGVPCAGKSTVARWIADNMLARPHISMGDLIRAARSDSSEFKHASELAYSGREIFPVDLLFSLLVRQLQKLGCQFEDVVVDGGPPMEIVASRLMRRPPLCIVLVTTHDRAMSRFYQRSCSQEGRLDDLDHLFEARTNLYRRTLPLTVAEMNKLGPVLKIRADVPMRSVLRQITSALLLAPSLDRLHTPATIQVGKNERWSSVARKLWDGNLGAEGLIVQGPRELDRIVFNTPVLLLKPGIKFRPLVIDQIEKRLAERGYVIDRMAFWSGEAIRARGAIEAHLDIQYALARWGSRGLLSQEAVPEKISAYDYVVRYGESALTAAWEGTATGELIHESEGNWVKLHRRSSGYIYKIINGHIPEHVDRYRATGALTTVLGLRSKKEYSASWRSMRVNFLGATNPAHAYPWTLRGGAFLNRLAIEGKVTFKNNAFHLSRGPLEALRESLIWFGVSPEREEMSFNEIFFDTPLQSEGEPWVFAASAELDAADAELKRIIAQVQAWRKWL